MAYRWLKAVHKGMQNRTDFVGATLTSDQMSILSSSPKGPLTAPKNDTILMYKCFGTWGFSPKPEHWRRFQVRFCFTWLNVVLAECWFRIINHLGYLSGVLSRFQKSGGGVCIYEGLHEVEIELDECFRLRCSMFVRVSLNSLPDSSSHSI